MSISLLQFIPAAILIGLGVAVMVIETFGIFRIHYVLNRLHAAAMGDSLGILLIALGAAVLFGVSFVTLKILCIVLLIWIASPTCAHLMASLEIFTNEHIEEECELPAETGGEEPVQEDAARFP